MRPKKKFQVRSSNQNQQVNEIREKILISVRYLDKT